MEPISLESLGLNAATISIFFAIISILGLVMIAINAFVYCKIFSKTGHGWAFGLLALIPGANLILLCVVAFSDWPILKELRQFKN
ncbi:MAG: hypothetical protein PHF37_06005 [Phycisphaerae bacterium]|nr:hypothetical protein [Phycisphaerae bacterium]